MVRPCHPRVIEESDRVRHEAEDEDDVRAEGLRERPRKPEHRRSREAANQAEDAHVRARPPHLPNANVSEVLDAPRRRPDHEHEEEEHERVRVLRQEAQSPRDVGRGGPLLFRLPVVFPGCDRPAAALALLLRSEGAHAEEYRYREHGVRREGPLVPPRQAHRRHPPAE